MKSSQLLHAPHIRYIVPFFVFMLFTEGQRYTSGSVIFLVYGLKTVSTAFVLWLFFRNRPEEFPGKLSIEPFLLGLVALAIWIPLCEAAAPLDKSAFQAEWVENTVLRFMAIAVRIAGAVLVVPIMEELLWRSFLMRYLIDPNFTKIPIGKYTHFSFWLTCVAFVLVHRPWEWGAAFITAILYGGYLVKTANLRGVIMAHAVTNLGLAVYVLVTGRWYFW